MADANQWEYTVFSLGSIWRGPKDEDLEALLNELGEQGWEVVSSYTITNSNKVNIIVKRPLTASTRRMRSLPR